MARVQAFARLYTGAHVVPGTAWPATFSDKAIQKRQGRAKTALLRVSPFALEELITDPVMRVLRLYIETDYAKTLAEFTPEEVDELEEKTWNL